MSKFEPSKQHLREVLIFLFNSKKNASQACELLSETYPDYKIDVRMCQCWFARFKSGDFVTDDKERPGPVKKFEDVELQTLIDQDPSQTQEELAAALGVNQPAIRKRLKALGMIRKVGHWVPYELRPRDVDRRFFTCEELLKRHIRKGFLDRIVSGDEKWIHYDNPKRKATYGYPGHATTSTANPNIHGLKIMLCISWDQLGVVYYELLQPNETITGEVYRR